MSIEYYKKALEAEAHKIHNELTRTLALHCLEKLPEYWWITPSSSSGKYHPPDEHGKCGLALHTLRVCQTAEILMEAWKPPFYIDSVKLACLFHDAARYGFNKDPVKHSLDDHPQLSSDWLGTMAFETQEFSEHMGPHFDYLEVACTAIRRHTGRWGKEPPETPEDWIVHLADCIAAHKGSVS